MRSKDGRHFGIVVRAYQNDESDEFSSDEDDLDEEEKVSEGKVMIGWYSSNPRWNNKDTEVIEEEKVCVIFQLI